MKTKEIANQEFFSLMEQVIDDSGKVRFRVKGVSMQPLLRNNRDEVLLSKLGSRTPQIGDICLFKFNGHYILHRFMSRKGDILYMRGDNVLGNFEWCKLEDVVGIVDVVYRGQKEISPHSVFWHYLTLVHRFKGMIIRPLIGVLHRLRSM